MSKPLSGARAAAQTVLALGIACIGFPPPGNAEVRVSGHASAVTVYTQGASLEEALRALQASLKFHYRATGALNDMISGTYSGSLSHVVNRLLAGRDYVMHGTPNDLAVLIFAPSSTAPTRGMVHAVPAAAQSEPLDKCQYKVGDQIVEC
jgi:hypothetical protein